MIPIIANRYFTRLGALDDYKSFIWTTRYYDQGDFEISIGISQKAVALLQLGNYVMRDDDDNIGIIESVRVNIAEDDEQTIIASGKFLTTILSRRIVATQTEVTGTVSSCINQLITDAIISPAIAARQIDNFILGDYSTAQTMTAQYTGNNLAQVISDLCKQYGLGFKVTLTDANEFRFELYEGIDRSYGQSVNPYVVFSDAYDNLINAQYQESLEVLVTNVLAAGEGEGSERKTIWVTSDDPEGLDRYEAFKDARYLSSNNGEISDADYMDQLAEAGREDLTTYSTAFAGEVDFRNIKWKEDVNIGDICSIENTTLNLHVNSRLIEVIENVDEAGKYSIIPTFGL